MEDNGVQTNSNASLVGMGSFESNTGRKENNASDNCCDLKMASVKSVQGIVDIDHLWDNLKWKYCLNVLST